MATVAERDFPEREVRDSSSAALTGAKDLRVSIKNIVQPGFLTAMVMALVIAIGMFIEIRLTTLRSLNGRWCNGYLGGGSPI